jgi:hypothetical protein
MVKSRGVTSTGQHDGTARVAESGWWCGREPIVRDYARDSNKSELSMNQDENMW